MPGLRRRGGGAAGARAGPTWRAARWAAPPTAPSHASLPPRRDRARNTANALQALQVKSAQLSGTSDVLLASQDREWLADLFVGCACWHTAGPALAADRDLEWGLAGLGACGGLGGSAGGRGQQQSCCPAPAAWRARPRSRTGLAPHPGLRPVCRVALARSPARLHARVPAEVTQALVQQGNLSQPVAAVTVGVLTGASAALREVAPTLQGAVAFLNDTVLSVSACRACVPACGCPRGRRWLLEGGWLRARGQGGSCCAEAARSRRRSMFPPGGFTAALPRRCPPPALMPSSGADARPAPCALARRPPGAPQAIDSIQADFEPPTMAVQNTWCAAAARPAPWGLPLHAPRLLHLGGLLACTRSGRTLPGRRRAAGRAPTCSAALGSRAARVRGRPAARCVLAPPPPVCRRRFLPIAIIFGLLVLIVL